MILLHNIGTRQHPNYNSIGDILASQGPISFDGVYRNVFSHMSALEDLKGKRQIILFVMGDYVGADNTFDTGMPREALCSWDEIIQLCQFTGAEMGWHTYAHLDLTLLTEKEIREELTPPFYMKYLAYPYGNFDERVLKIVEEIGYEDAWSVHQGNGERFQRNRSYLCQSR